MDKVQDADMDAFLQCIIILARFYLPGICLAQIKQNPVGPELEISNLHLHIDLGPVLHFHLHIQDSLLGISGFSVQFSRNQSGLPNLLRILA